MGGRVIFVGGVVWVDFTDICEFEVRVFGFIVEEDMFFVLVLNVDVD